VSVDPGLDGSTGREGEFPFKSGASGGAQHVENPQSFGTPGRRPNATVRLDHELYESASKVE
jgi:hypothetical protein